MIIASYDFVKKQTSEQICEQSEYLEEERKY